MATDLEPVLLSAADETGSWAKWAGGPGSLYVKGTFDGATVALEWREYDDTNGEIAVGDDASFTAAGMCNFDLPEGEIRCTIASAGTTSVTAKTRRRRG